MVPIKIAFLWHQHQPYYKQPDTDVYTLPWVRLHALKDYFDMVEILDSFPKIHQNFNLVPSLLLQLEDYVQNEAKDEILLRTEIPAEALSPDDKYFLLNYFFMVNAEHLILPFPGYKRLWKKRGTDLSESGLRQAVQSFTTQDFLDLQIWYNLSWTGESHKKRSPFKELIEKDHDFTEEDKHVLLSSQKAILKEIIPKHRELSEKGQIELSTTPFYHPIVPLLCDTESAKMAMPGATLPSPAFKHPEDAGEHIRRGLDFFQKRFGSKPAGMWPSEGSVSDEAASLFAENGIRWIATDEEILFKSLPLNKLPLRDRTSTLYQSYQLETKNGPIHIFFRDHTLSDLIGFVYQKWPAEEAATDFVSRILDIRSQISAQFGEKRLESSIISIILDGENCWEFYPENGRPFLEALYSRLSETGEIQSVTLSEFLDQSSPSQQLTKIFAGSWINHNFSVWIGHPEENKAWEFLNRARSALEEAKAKGISAETGELAFRQIMIAEGSDWFWWFGDDHHTENAAEFDSLFRGHLIKLYELLQRDVPPELYEPIHQEKVKKLAIKDPQGFIHPVIDGTYSNYFEWLGAGVFEAVPAGSSMHMVSALIARIFFGFDLENLFIRVEPRTKLLPDKIPNYSIIFDFLKPRRLRVTFPGKELLKGKFTATIQKRVDSAWEETDFTARGAYRDFIEIQMPFKALGVHTGDEIGFQVRILENNEPLEEWPENELILVTVPGKDFESEDWLV
ncbi:MAG: glycoside hydrolase [Calditrichaeota bacterium]|nr:glycoside hydrolase [Calditrichota bacterium]